LSVAFIILNGRHFDLLLWGYYYKMAKVTKATFIARVASCSLSKYLSFSIILPIISSVTLSFVLLTSLCIPYLRKWDETEASKVREKTYSEWIRWRNTDGLPWHHM